jgi:hypothetical protein
MLKRFAVPLLLVEVVAAVAVALFFPAPPAGAGNVSAGKSNALATVARRDSKCDAASRVAPPDSLTARAVSAARGFEVSLSSVQRASVQYSFNSPKKSGWSSVPTNLAPRNGVEVSDLSDHQRARLWALLRTIMSPQGYIDEVGVRKADTYLSIKYRGGTTPASKFLYGQGRYYIALFGTPSRSTKWMVQFTGHHYTVNMTFNGTNVSNTPYFIGVNPPTAFKLDGHTYQPMVHQVAAMFGAVQSLDATQRARARLSERFKDVLVGAGRDGQFPPRQGITVSTLDSKQQKLVTRAISSYVGVMPRDQADRVVATYEKQYSQTKLAWSASTNATTPGAYVRIQGPRVYIEISRTTLGELVGEIVHYHSIERDIQNDYGGCR